MLLLTRAPVSMWPMKTLLQSDRMRTSTPRQPAHCSTSPTGWASRHALIHPYPLVDAHMPTTARHAGQGGTRGAGAEGRGGSPHPEQAEGGLRDLGPHAAQLRQDRVSADTAPLHLSEHRIGDWHEIGWHLHIYGIPSPVSGTIKDVGPLASSGF